MRGNAARIAVQSRGDTLTYGELLERAHTLARELAAHACPGDRIGLAGERGVEHYVALLAVWLAGCAYVPLNAKAPPERNADILARSGAIGLLTARDGEAAFTVRAPQTGRLPFPDGAYIIYTSGTTGRPKGVPITGSNLAAYLASLEALFTIRPDDRVAHLSDLSFDLSVHELLLAWSSGAALCCIPPSAALMASRYVEEDGITVWVSVPSTISLAYQAGTLRAGSMEPLRLAFFCGEALSIVTARQFAQAAPSARIYNLWGPTETTVSLSYFEVDVDAELPDIVPIGRPYPGQSLELAEPKDGVGELVAAGQQVTQGYWAAPELDAGRFVQRDGRPWYRTGDLAAWDERYGYCYKGRIDRQVKIKGYRVELQECESALRACGAWDLVGVIAWPKSADGSASGLVGFVLAQAVDAAGVKASLSNTLPPYMVPDRIVALTAFPFSANGKIDYRALEGLA
jgi:D-alanine--poly(phosphoribitol) ligase subunit 1